MAANNDRWQSTRDRVNDVAERLHLPPIFWEPPLDYRQSDGDTPYDIPPPAEDRPRARYLYTLSIAFSLVLHGAVLGYAGTYIFLSQHESSASVDSTASISVDLVDRDDLDAARREGTREAALAPALADKPESNEQQNVQIVEKTAQNEPDTPNKPDEPSAPKTPDEPNAPDEPSAPDTPDDPNAPNEPEAPVAPPEQIDTKATQPDGASDEGKEAKPEAESDRPTVLARAETETEAKAETASYQQTEEASLPQNVASIDPAPPIPVVNPRRDVQMSETTEHSDRGSAELSKTASRNRHSSSHSRRTSANLTQVFAYRQSVRAYLAANKPSGGRGKGTVRVTFILSSTGRVVAARVTRSSGKRVLDQAALGAVYDASPFPHPPIGIRTSRLRFSIPFYFR
jgi:protein TonB